MLPDHQRSQPDGSRLQAKENAGIIHDDDGYEAHWDEGEDGGWMTL
jgi:hypothetical protein